MAYYNVCSKCGCNLDPGERCDCESIKTTKLQTNRAYYNQFLKTDTKGGQMVFVFDHQKGGAVGA